MTIDQLKFYCKRCMLEANPVKKDATSYTVKCGNDSCKLSLQFVAPRTVKLSLRLGTLQDNLRDYFVVEKQAMDIAADLRVWLFCDEHGHVGILGLGSGCMVGCSECTTSLLVCEVSDGGEFRFSSPPVPTLHAYRKLQDGGWLEL